MTDSYFSIQYLRGLAALMVVLLHLSTGGFFPQSAATEWLGGGVDIFFVISGFIMVKSTQGKTYSPKQFYVKRIMRIVPLYWLATLVTVQASGWTGWHSIASFLFIPMQHPTDAVFLPVLQPGWTLNYEMFFYLIFGASLLLPEKNRLIWLGAGLALLVMGGIIFQPTGVAGFYLNPIILEFVCGMIIAKSRRKMPIIVVPLALFFMPLLCGLTDQRFFSLGLPAMLLVWGIISAEPKMPEIRAFSLVGDASYAIYLFHPLVLGTAQIFITGEPGKSIWLVLVVLMATIAFGVMAHLFLEKPFSLFLSDWMYKYRKKQGDDGASKTSQKQLQNEIT
ncbi:MAG: acyltransferase [Parasphingorhabdus sp.]|uniref:acyltransferase family protein n=1 Tax=Parasphingorhabdus sp. TaxID=2709688 RepID=UPI00300264F2